MFKTDFEKFANSMGINSLTLGRYRKDIDAIISPNIVEERVGNPLMIDVFSKLFTNRILFLGTAIDNDVANIINSQLLYLKMDGPQKGIDLYINSPGGSVYDGMSIYDTMQYLDCPVNTTCMGLAASMASVLLIGGEKGGRAALPHSRIMLHQPLGNTGYGQASDIEIYNREIQKIKQELLETLSNHTGIDSEKLEKLCDRDKWLTASEAVEMNLIDTVIKKAN